MHKQKMERFDKLWISCFVATLLTIISLYIANYFSAIEFSIFDVIALFLYTAIPGSLVIVVLWATIKAEQIKEIPKKSLVFLALSFVSWFAAEQTWNFYEQVLETEPFPSMADVFYIIAPFFMFISLFIFLKPLKKQIPKRSIFFASLISAVSLIPTIIIAYNSDSNEIIETVIGLAYPALDALVLIPVIITILFLIQRRKNLFWIMILAGVLVFVIADTLFLFLTLTEQYTTHHLIDVLWITSYVVWFFSLLRSIHNSRHVSDKETNYSVQSETQNITKYGISIFLVIINITVAIVLFSIRYLQPPQTDTSFLDYFSIVLVMLMIIFSVGIFLLNKILYKNLIQRTKELEHISQEFIKAERLSAIGELSARLAHDLRNPLSVIKMTTDLLKQTTTKLDPVLDKRINLMSKSIDRMTHQIENVLDYVRKSPLETTNTSVRKIILDAIEKIKIPDDVKITIFEKDMHIQCDPVKLDAVFVNLIINSIQAIPDKGEIEIRGDEKEDKIVLEFVDSGIGIPKDSLEHVFEPLFTTKQKGTGLGLASCKNIIEQHGGTISVSTNPTTFTIILPKTILVSS
ncbi:ATP-binding protein [Nitrosopumilus sp.]|uniref:sensor histidine kinase n=1 Tax=Nitrosopumilus sp. TaxID=2024843 RepID=UPI00247DB388|nr:ATP-binding protein [Nitrosopumilus sp.]MCV0430651.1 GHKL domain-containing protein [Nitrosopumilus sp.]